MRKTVVLLSLLFAAGLAFAEALFECQFAPGKWDKADFLEVKSSRWENINFFGQEKDHIVNLCPKDAAPEELLTKRAPETYAAMLYAKPLTGNHTITAKMSFDYRMAPALLIAEAPGKSAQGYPELRNHYEIVLFDQGLNVWRHWFKDGKQVWRKVGFLNAEFKANKVYELKVNIAFTGRGPVWTVSCDGHTFGFVDDLLPGEYFAGVVAGEGVNRFYDLVIQ